MNEGFEVSYKNEKRQPPNLSRLGLALVARKISFGLSPGRASRAADVHPNFRREYA